MSSEFAIIREEFDAELVAIQGIIAPFADPRTVQPKARVAAVNAATLLLAATFEEFIREMATAYAKLIVGRCTAVADLPSKFLETAWRRSLNTLSNMPKDIKEAGVMRESALNAAETSFSNIMEFSRGDLTRDIFSELIHNENNMRVKEANSLFALSGLSNVCLLVCDKAPLLTHFSETEPGKANGQLQLELDDFMNRRNQIAHSISTMRSSGPDTLAKDCQMLDALGKALCETLEAITS